MFPSDSIVSYPVKQKTRQLTDVSVSGFFRLIRTAISAFKVQRASFAPERKLVVLPGDAPGSDAYKAPALLLSYRTMEVPVRIGLTFRVLQTLAFPLGYGTVW